MSISKLGEQLHEDKILYMEIFVKSCKKTILEMLKNSQSGHPGGSLSCLDYLTVLYVCRLSQTLEPMVASNGHISPAVYSIFANLGYVNINDVIKNFRKLGSPFEGHTSHKVPGIPYSTGSLGIGASAAAGMALSNKIKQCNDKVYAVMGDGELQEGQVWEMVNFAKNYKLDNFIVFVDYNKVQLSGAIDTICPIDVEGLFKAANWHIIRIDGHNISQIWNAISEANTITGKPVVIIGDTIMGKGVELMESDGVALKSTWHGKVPSVSQLEAEIQKLELSSEEIEKLCALQSDFSKRPVVREHIDLLASLDMDVGTPRLYTDTTDCRTAYGNALKDLAEKNPRIVALSSDVAGSVMTSILAKDMPQRHIECGIAEQNMVSVAGGLSISGHIPFVSTFGVFLSSRVKDQVRMNDLNETNVKMVATHCGLSVGEDGKTHHEIDGMASFLGMPNMMVAEPADANMTDRMIRYFASHYGNVYIRMGRHKVPVIVKSDGTSFYDEQYEYEYGKTDTVIEGSDLTVVAIGSAASEAFGACKELQTTHPELSIELVVASSIKKFDDDLLNSIKKTGKLITVEDHVTACGLGTMLADTLLSNNIPVQKIEKLGIKEYQSSAKYIDLYDKVGISAKKIAVSIVEFLGK